MRFKRNGSQPERSPVGALHSPAPPEPLAAVGYSAAATRQRKPLPGTVNPPCPESSPNKAAHHAHIPPAATAPPTAARRAYPSTTRLTTTTSTPPSDTHPNGAANAGETIGRVTAVGGRSGPQRRGSPLLSAVNPLVRVRLRTGSGVQVPHAVPLPLGMPGAATG